LFGTCALIALAPLAGQTLEQWAPVAASYAVRLIRGRTRFRSPLPDRGFTAARLAGERRLRLSEPGAISPAPVGALRILEAAYGTRSIGVLAARSGRHLTAVLACRVVAFSLLDGDAQERRMARWGLVLSNAASTPISRLQWLERTAPAQGDELARWVYEQRDPAIPPRGTPIVESYLELIGRTTQVTQEHEILLAVQLDARRIRDRDRQAGVRELIEQTERVAQGLEAAEVSVLGALSAGQLARALRTSFDPYARAELASLEAADRRRDGLTEANAWPLGACEKWDHYRCEGAVHATYWIAGWPRVDVSPMFMDALLGRSSAVRTVAVTFEPIAPGRSTREVEAALTRDRADRQLRQRFGQSETARQRQAHEATLRREAELAAGHSEVRFAGFVTVSGRDLGDLRRATAEVLEHAARARLELHRMYGRQADAFTFTLPLCRGLR
jgi:hypothetical protein